MNLRKRIILCLCVGVVITLLLSSGMLLFRTDKGFSMLSHPQKVLIGPPVSSEIAGMVAERSAVPRGSMFSSQVFFGSGVDPERYGSLEITVDAADFVVSMDVPQMLNIGENGYAAEQFFFNGVINKAEDLPFNFHFSLTPAWKEGEKEGVVELVLTIRYVSDSGNDYGMTSRCITLYYSGSEKNVCFSTRSPEHARWLLWWHDL